MGKGALHRGHSAGIGTHDESWHRRPVCARLRIVKGLGLRVCEPAREGVTVYINGRDDTRLTAAFRPNREHRLCDDCCFFNQPARRRCD